MIITSNWVIDYIKKHGTDIIIPKEAIKIEQGAFDSFTLNGQFGENYCDQVMFTLNFEANSKLIEIESGSFSGVNISNEILIPNTVEKMGQLSFIHQFIMLILVIIQGLKILAFQIVCHFHPKWLFLLK